jgi:cytochrome P450
MLALHQDQQQKLYDELRNIVPPSESPVCSFGLSVSSSSLIVLQTYADIVRWSSGLALIYEVLRLYPPVSAHECSKG